MASKVRDFFLAYLLKIYIFVRKPKNVKMKYRHWSGWIILLTLAGIVGCSRAGQDRKGRNLGVYEAFMREMEDSLTKDPAGIYNRLDSALASAPDSMSYYRNMLLKAKALFYTAEFDSMVPLMDCVRAYCDRSDDNAAIQGLYCQIYNMEGNLYGRKSEMDLSAKAFEKAYACGLAAGEREKLPYICINLADAYVRGGRFDLGSFWYRRTLSMFDSLQVAEKDRFPVYYGLAQVSMELRNFDRCDYYFNLAERSFDQMRPYEKHVYLNNRGNSYYFRQDYPTALGYFRRSLALTQKYPDMEFERNLTMINMGEVFLLMNQTDSSAYYLSRCYDFFRRVNNQTALYYIDTQLIELALKQKNLPLARMRLKNAVKPDYVEPNMVNVRNRYLQHFYEESGDFRKAYHYLQENKRIDDSIRSERVKMRAAEIALKYRQDSTLIQKEISIQQKENQLLHLHQWLYGLVGCILLLGTAALALYLYRRRKIDKERWKLQTAITSLRLENIRNRISPHFIFNVLNREVSERKENPGNTNLMGLIKLMRRNLELTDSLAVTLADELDFVHTYVSLEQKSLGEEFRFEVSTGDVDQNVVRVPSMLLQIPVENAIKHALRLKEGKRRLWIRVMQEGERVVATVCDNGGGYRRQSVNRGTGTGMKVITQTIQLLNSYNRQSIVMTISNVPVEDGETGCEVRFTIPLHYSYRLTK